MSSVQSDPDVEEPNHKFHGVNSSPHSLRRSTRVSALRAAERLRSDGTAVRGEETSPTKTKDALEADYLKEDEEMEIVDGLPVKFLVESTTGKRRRIANPHFLDPTNPHFAIQETEDGRVVVLSDDSEVSSLDEEEIAFVRTSYQKLSAKELTDEQRMERERIIRTLKAELRCEEAKLLLLRKMRMTQQVAPVVQRDPLTQQQPPTAPVAQLSRTPQMPTLVRANQPGGVAYRPPVAAPPQLTRGQPAVNNVSRPNMPVSTITRNQTTQRPGVITSSQQAAVRHGVIPPAHQGQSLSAGGAQVQKRASPAPAHVNRPQTAAQDSLTPDQRQAAAKLALRKQLEKTLLQIPPPKPPQPELHFVPNPNQPDFVYFVGLDNVVQRVLESKERKAQREEAKAAKESGAAATDSADNSRDMTQVKEPPSKRKKEVVPPPFECAQCGTDFTPLWKTEVTANGNTRVMCETCVRSNQKKALKAEHTNRLKQAFVKALQQEQEIEQQIQAGNYRNLPTVSAGPPNAAIVPAAASKPSTPLTAARGSSQNQAASSATAAAAVAAASASLGLAGGLGASSLPLGFQAQLMGLAGVGWNPFMRMPTATGFPANLMQQNQQLSKEFLKSWQQQSALQQKMFMDLLQQQQQQQKKK